MESFKYEVVDGKLRWGAKARPATDAEIALWQECERLRDVLRRIHERMTAQPNGSLPSDLLNEQTISRY